ncbi:Uncharacterised protein [uncultured archaeon]|nr:Uncharacterised protein [uncultured archaeon]
MHHAPNLAPFTPLMFILIYGGLFLVVKRWK